MGKIIRFAKYSYIEKLIKTKLHPLEFRREIASLQIKNRTNIYGCQ
jgi:hypothetical protein